MAAGIGERTRMARLRVMTFNVENMFTRFDFRRAEDLDDYLGLLEGEDAASRLALAKAARLILDDEIRTFCALTLRQVGPDIVLLQEVESLHALRRFHDKYLLGVGGEPLPHLAVLEGNDGRGIDVAVLSRLPLETVQSHKELSLGDLYASGFTWEAHGLSRAAMDRDRLFGDPRMRVFRRDCLEVHVDVAGRPLALFNCHFKSLGAGRLETRPFRLAEAAAVAQLLRQAQARGRRDYLVAGDLNDFTETDGVPDPAHGLGPLLDSGLVVDTVKRIADPRDRWTHFYARDRVYNQLDYLLLSPALAARNPEPPRIVRSGMPYRAERATVPRFPRIGWDRPKASDHCAVVMDLEF